VSSDQDLFRLSADGTWLSRMLAGPLSQ